MAGLKAVLLDLGGVIFVGDAALPGAIAAVGRLRDAGLGVRFLTNTTRTPHRLLRDKLINMGLAVAPEELFTPAIAARHRIEQEGLSPHLLIHPDLVEDFTDLAAGDGGEAVVIGDAGDSFTYAALNAAFRALDRGAAFLALANNRSFRDADGELSLDAGPFVAALAYASRREPMVLGKPAPAFFQAALTSLGCMADEAVMIGDDVESDVAGALAAGITGILVKTGKYRPGDESDIDPPPTALAENLTAAVEALLTGAIG